MRDEVWTWWGTTRNDVRNKEKKFSSAQGRDGAGKKFRIFRRGSEAVDR